MVWVDLDVFIWDLLLFEHRPRSLHERAEPAGIEFERLSIFVSLSGSVIVRFQIIGRAIRRQSVSQRR